MDNLKQQGNLNSGHYSAICKYNNCGGIANRTQKLIDGKPAPYKSQTKSVEGIKMNETYEPRCLEHHFVPRMKK